MFRPPQLRAVWGRVAIAATLLVAVPGVARAIRAQPVSGTITDQQGGVVPGVTVTATPGADTAGRTSPSPTSPASTRFRRCMPGQYDDQRRARGLQEDHPHGRAARRGGQLTIDFTLETGALTEAVTVTAEATPLQTDVAIRKTVEAKDIEQLSF